jgi:glycerophosphoryl diester phosphodiesterase
VHRAAATMCRHIMSADGVFGPSPVLLGHRGCGRGIVQGHVENTLESFLAAVELGIDWVEVDVRRTADDDLVVAHHPAEDDGVFYADISGDEASDRGVLRLEELLEALPPGIGVDLDVKTSMEDATRERAQTTMGRLAPVAARLVRHRPVLVTSFDPSALDIARELAPSAPRGLLTWLEFPVGQAVAAAGHLDVQVLAVHWGSLRPNDVEPETLHRPLSYVVDLVHDSGREFLAWCPKQRFALELLEAGVDALCVNNVPKVLSALTAGAARAS